MAFSINTNLNSIQAYNAVAKTNAQTLKAQLCISTLKKVNSVADNTSGYNVGKKLEAQKLEQQSQLSNISSAQNYLSTAETALQQVNDKLNAISAKYADAQDPLKDKDSIANDINTLAGEVDSILKNTNINGKNLLAQSDGSALASSDSFDIGGGSDFTVDFASDSYLKVDSLKTLLSGGIVADPGVATYEGTSYFNHTVMPAINSTVRITYADGTHDDVNFTNVAGMSLLSVSDNLEDEISHQTDVDMPYTYDNPEHSYEHRTVTCNTKNIVSLETISGYDITTAIGITRKSTSSSDNCLLSTDTNKVLAAAGNISEVQNNVRAALGRIGNLTQTANSRDEYLTASITNTTDTISSIFDADITVEQIKSTKNSIAFQLGTSMLSQMNSAPQQLLSLFR